MSTSWTFTLITANEYVGRKQYEATHDDVDACECAAHWPEGPICADDTCLNRLSRKECMACDKRRCRNRRITAGKWANVENFKVCALLGPQRGEGEAPSPSPVADVCVDGGAQTGTLKGQGLRAKEPIAKDQLIIEYVGEVIGQEEFETRLVEYRVRAAARWRRRCRCPDAVSWPRASCAVPRPPAPSQKCLHFYLLSLGMAPGSTSKREYIDAFRKGCLARYINHSCNPNATSEVWCVPH